MKPPMDMGWIYLIGYAGAGDDEPVKIGFGKDPRGRMHSLQTGSHRQLELRDQVPGTLAGEQALHEALSAFRVKREWFDRAEMIAVIFDAIHDRMLDLAEAKIGPHWTPSSGKGLDDYYEETPASLEVIRSEVARYIAYYDYAERTGDWECELDTPEARALGGRP